jgi:hypothetical protein
MIVVALVFACAGGAAAYFYLKYFHPLPSMIDYINYIDLPEKPALYMDSEVYVPYNFLLPVSFLRNGDVQLVSVQGYYTDYSMIGVQFSFKAGSQATTSPLFGVSKSATLNTSSKQMNITSTVTSVTRMMVNT